MEQQPLLSAIIPVYNTPESYLRACISSITNQSYSHFEVLMVDDGSAPACSQLCDELAATDTRITVYHKENGGVSSARNMALPLIKGEFLTFVDSDDTLFPHTWEIAITELLQSSADAVSFGWEDHLIDGTIVPHQICSSKQVLSNVDFQKEVSSHNIYCGGGYPWNKIWKTSLLRDAQGNLPLFDESLDIYEDKLWTLMAAQTASQVLLLTDILYQYRFIDSSLTHNKDTEIHRLYKAYYAYDLILDYLQQNNEKAYLYAYNFYYDFLYRDYKMMQDFKKEYPKQYVDTKAAIHRLCKRIKPRTLHFPLYAPQFRTWLFYYLLPKFNLR